MVARRIFGSAQPPPLSPGPNDFKVEVRTGPLDRPIYLKRKATMQFDPNEKDIIFAYNNGARRIPASTLYGVPWTPPQGRTLRFMADRSREEEVVVDFEDNAALKKAYILLKDEYLDKDQFIHSSEMCRRGRGLHTNTPQTSDENKTPERLKRPRDVRPVLQVGSHRGNVRELVEMFEQMEPKLNPPSRSTPTQSMPSRSRPPRSALLRGAPLLSTPPPEKKPFRTSLCDLAQKTPPSARRSEPATVGKNGNRDMHAEMYDDESDEEMPPLSDSPLKVNPPEPESPTEWEPIFTSTMQKSEFQKSQEISTSTGLANLGNTCYMNSMLQGLFAMDIFTKDLFKFCKSVQRHGIELNDLMPMSLALSSLASRRDDATFAQKKSFLMTIKNVSNFRGNAQQDANEFLVHVLNQVHDECEKLLRDRFDVTEIVERRRRNPVTANFAFTIKSTVICDACHNVTCTVEDSIILPVTINVLDQANERFSRNNLCLPSVQTLLDGCLNTEKVERTCEQCGEKSGQRTQKFIRIPRCLIVFIKRYAYDESKSVKRDDKIEIPMYLTLNGHCEDKVVPFPMVPPSTKKVNFATVSPLKRKLFRPIPLIGSPTPAKRRLDLSSDNATAGEECRTITIPDDAELVTLTSSISEPLVSWKISESPAITASGCVPTRLVKSGFLPLPKEGEENATTVTRSETIIGACASTSFEENEKPKDAEADEDKKDGVCLDDQKKQAIPNVCSLFDDTGSSSPMIGNLSRVSLPQPMANGNYRPEDLSLMSEEEQLQLACERSLTEKTGSGSEHNTGEQHSEMQQEDVKSLHEEEECAVQEEKTEVPRGLLEKEWNAIAEGTHCSKLRHSTEGNPENRPEEEEMEQEEGEDNSRKTPRNGCAEPEKKNDARETLPAADVNPGVAQARSGKVDGSRRQVVQRPSVIVDDFEEEARHRAYSATVAEWALEHDFDVPVFVKCTERMKTERRSNSETATEDQVLPIGPSTPAITKGSYDLEKEYSKSLKEILGEDPFEKMTAKKKGSDNDVKEITDGNITQPIPYKPLSIARRREICSRIGLINHHYIFEREQNKTKIRWMRKDDKPARIKDIMGDGNCLFRALAFYLSGSDVAYSKIRESIVEFETEHWKELAELKDWSAEEWNEHMDRLLTDATWGTEVELFAVAAMFNVDVYTFYEQRWLCYRQTFKVQDGVATPVTFTEHRMGNNEGIYLVNEGLHYSPVLLPSDKLLRSDGNEARTSGLLLNASEGFMKPSYRLVSVVSHLGSTSESGHYICDIWCGKRNSWYVCNDETVQRILESKLQARNDVGYIYFYLNT